MCVKDSIEPVKGFVRCAVALKVSFTHPPLYTDGASKVHGVVEVVREVIEDVAIVTLVDVAVGGVDEVGTH